MKLVDVAKRPVWPLSCFGVALTMLLKLLGALAGASLAAA